MQQKPHIWDRQPPGLRIRYFTYMAPRPIELLALRAGLRSLVKFEDVPLHAVSRVRARFPRGVHVLLGAPFVKHLPTGEAQRSGSGRRCVNLYVSWIKEKAEQLQQLEMTDPAGTAEACGELLGYPPCCVQAFASIRDHARDDALVLSILKATRQPQWRLNVLSDLALISFYPCRFDCEVALAQARKLESALSSHQRARVKKRLARAIRFETFANMAVLDGRIWRPNVLCDGDYQLTGELVDFRAIPSRR